MDHLAWAVLGAAAGVAFLHTLLGPDHFLPFVMLARARGWRPARALAITALCGAGHVLASVALGGIGIAAGWSFGRLESAETGRGPWAAWALAAFGVAYLLWGVRLAWRRRHRLEFHRHAVELREAGDRGVFWVLFAIFVLGPCEPLIPLFLLPASRSDWPLAVATAAVFGAVTVVTMLALVAAALAGARALRLGPLERWAEALAGGVIAASGLAIVGLGL